ncbi:MAG TPA: MFS transporter [Fontimonas sp.]
MRLSYKIWLLGSLYLAQGIPYGFFTQALPVLLREQGLSLKAISATSILFLPWMLRFLWAPLVDHYGTRRLWLLPLQLATVIVALSLAGTDPLDELWPILAGLFVFNLICATQDIATDGLAVNTLGPRERGLGNGIQVGGYRVGMILGGGLLLWISAMSGWEAMYFCMAGLLALAVLPVLFLREVPRPAAATTVRPDWSAAFKRLGQPGMLGFIGLIWIYKFGDTMGASPIGPFMHDMGISKTDIALIKGALGSTSSLVGAAAGGWLAWRIGRRSTLLAGGLLQTAALVLYALFAAGLGGTALLYAACIAEHVLGGIATVALFTLMMDASDPEHAGTDYSLLACAVVLCQGLASFAGASVADALGYVALFWTSVALSAIGCVVLVVAIDRGAGPERLARIWPRRGTT